MTFLRNLIAIAALVTALVACTYSRPTPLGENVTAEYRVPVTYQDHRDQQRTFATPDGAIAYTDHGTGPVMVLIHGVPTSSWMYRKVIADLQTSHRVISIDLLGFGSSDKPGDDQSDAYLPQRRAERVRALMASLGISAYGLLVHDMGGLVGWEVLRQSPDEVNRLVVLNTIVNQSGFNHPDMDPGGMTRSMMRLYSSRLAGSVILGRTFDDLGLVGDFELSETECVGYTRPIREGSDAALYTFFTGVNDDLFARLDENRTVLNGYQGETLVLWGAKDKTLTTDQIPLLKAMLNVPDENIHIYTENAHFLAEEMPEEIVRKIRETF